ncbi:unnamed protein product [Arctia plantaginis]|uniref:Uncharacterized protein n=1 Tax=Arctia plantaginis TaxID=874455 RepID=A0A8S0YXC6_ARCPL|nr:unnamed protein product [Arctia plantaginis]CAB3253480.1 unnamed protein product [Arctia plantaginis]
MKEAIRVALYFTVYVLGVIAYVKISTKFCEGDLGWEGRTEIGGGENGESPPPAHAPLDAVWQPVAGTRYVLDLGAW